MSQQRPIEEQVATNPQAPQVVEPMEEEVEIHQAEPSGHQGLQDQVEFVQQQEAQQLDDDKNLMRAQENVNVNPHTDNNSHSQDLDSQAANSAVINRYEQRVYSLQQKLNSSTLKLQQVQEQNLELKAQLSFQTQKTIVSGYKVQQLEAKFESLSGHRQQLRLQNVQLIDRLKSFESQESIDDVKKELSLSQACIQGLKLQVQSLTERLTLQSSTRHSPQLESLKLFQDQRKKVESLSNQLFSLYGRLKQQQDSKTLIHSQLRQRQQRIKQLQEEIGTAQQSHHDMQILLSSVQLQHKKIQEDNHKKELELTRLQNMSQNHSGNYLTEKEQILKDYIGLEKEFAIYRETLERTQSQKEQLEVKLRKIQAATVPRDQFESLSRRYLIAKQRLQKSFNNEQLEVAMMSEEQPLLQLRGKISHEESKQAEIMKRLETGLVNGKYDGLEVQTQKERIQKLQCEYAQCKYQSEHYKQDLDIVQGKLAQSVDKCIELSNLINTQSRKWTLTDTTNKELASQNQILKVQMDAVQAHILTLTNTTLKLEKISNSYKIAYEGLKEEVSNMQINVPKSQRGQTLQTPISQQPLQFRIVQIPSKIPVVAQSTQTPRQDVSHLKSLTSLFQDFPKKLNSLLVELQESNRKGKLLQNKYNLKFLALKKDRQENEAWRSGVRQEIIVQVRKEFTEIKDVIDNERLLNAMIKAKYLIDWYYNQNQANNQNQAVNQDQNLIVDQGQNHSNTQVHMQVQNQTGTANQDENQNQNGIENPNQNQTGIETENHDDANQANQDPTLQL